MEPNFQIELKEKEKTSSNHYLLSRNFLFDSLRSKRFCASSWKHNSTFAFVSSNNVSHSLQGPTGRFSVSPFTTLCTTAKEKISDKE